MAIGKTLKELPELFRILSKGKGLGDESGEGMRYQNIKTDVAPPVKETPSVKGEVDPQAKADETIIDPDVGDRPIDPNAPDPESFDPSKRPFERDQGTVDVDEAGDLVESIDGVAPDKADKTSNVNINRVDTVYDIENMIESSSKMNVTRGMDAPRDSLAAMEKRSDEYGLKDILGHDPVKDGVMLPAKAVGARNLLVEMGEQLYQEARVIKNNSLTTNPEQLFAFRQNIAKYNAVLAVVEGQTRLAGQLLGSFRIPAKATGKIRDLHVANLLEEMGGPKTALTMAKAIAEKKSLKAVANATKTGWFIKSVRRAEQFRYNSMLFGINTHMRNFIGNSAAMLGHIAETPFVSAAGRTRKGITKALGKERTVDPSDDYVRGSEALVQILSLPAGMMDGFRLAGKALRDPNFAVGGKKTFDLSDRNWAMRNYAWANKNPLLRSMAFLTDVFLLNGATRALNAGDSFFKGIAYRMEKNSVALRRAMNEGKTGKDMLARVEELMKDMPAEDYIKAMDEMQVMTFTNRMQGETLLQLQRAINRTPGASLAVPFFGTLVNLASWTMRRTPMAPLTPSFWRAVQKGGIDADKAFGQAMAGTVLVAAPVWQMVREKKLTGSGSFLSEQTRRNWIKAGWRPNAILGDDGVYHVIRGGAPMATLMLTYASLFEAAGFMEDENARTDIFLGAAFMFGEIALDQTFARGLADWVDAIAKPEPWKSSALARSTATSFTPAWLRDARRWSDPKQRETNLGSFSERLTAQFMNQIPGLSDNLPPTVGYFGDPAPIGYDLISVFPGYASAPDMDLYHHLDKNGYRMMKPKPVIRVAGQAIDLNKDMSDAKGKGYVYHHYQKFLGHARRDIMRQLVENQEYLDAPEGLMGTGTGEQRTRGDYINRVMSRARGIALFELAERYGDTVLEDLVQREMDEGNFEVHPTMTHIQRDRLKQGTDNIGVMENLNLGEQQNEEVREEGVHF